MYTMYTPLCLHDISWEMTPVFRQWDGRAKGLVWFHWLITQICANICKICNIYIYIIGYVLHLSPSIYLYLSLAFYLSVYLFFFIMVQRGTSCGTSCTCDSQVANCLVPLLHTRPQYSMWPYLGELVAPNPHTFPSCFLWR